MKIYNQVPLGVKIDDDMRRQLEEIAKQERRKLSEIVRFMLEEGIAKRQGIPLQVVFRDGDDLEV